MERINTRRAGGAGVPVGDGMGVMEGVRVGAAVGGRVAVGVSVGMMGAVCS